MSAIAFVGRGRSLAVGLQDGRVGYHGPSPEGPSRQPVWLLGHGGPISSLAASRDGERLVSASADGTIRVWSTPPAVSPVPADLAAEVRERARLLCIQPEDRARFLGEPEPLAREAARTCVSGLGL